MLYLRLYFSKTPLDIMTSLIVESKKAFALNIPAYNWDLEDIEGSRLET